MRQPPGADQNLQGGGGARTISGRGAYCGSGASTGTSGRYAASAAADGRGIGGGGAPGGSGVSSVGGAIICGAGAVGGGRGRRVPGGGLGFGYIWGTLPVQSQSHLSAHVTTCKITAFEH